MPKINNTIQLTAFRAASAGYKAGAPLPTRFCVLPWGMHNTPKGKVIMNDLSAGSLAKANGEGSGFERVAIDFEHGTLNGQEPQKVAGFGNVEVIPGDGVYLNAVEWTPEGIEFAGHYPDLSPCVKRNAQGEVTYLHSVALTRQGAVPDLTFFSAPDPTNSNSMNRNLLIVSLFALLGVTVSETATDEELTAALAQAKAVEAKEPAADVKEETVGMSADVKAMFTALTAKIEALTTKTQGDERQQLISDATASGKLIPLSAAKLATVPLDVLRDMIDSLDEDVVPLSARRKHTKETQEPAVDDEVASLLGLSADDVKKFAPKA